MLARLKVNGRVFLSDYTSALHGVMANNDTIDLISWASDDRLIVTKVWAFLLQYLHSIPFPEMWFHKMNSHFGVDFVLVDGVEGEQEREIVRNDLI